MSAIGPKRTWPRAPHTSAFGGEADIRRLRADPTSRAVARTGTMSVIQFGGRMRRREFIGLIGCAAAWPAGVRAQQRSAIPVIGYLSSLRQADSVHFDAAFRRGLSEMGYVEGQTVSIDYHWITDRYSSLPVTATDLVQHQVAMICAFGPPAVLAAKAATATIPIVFVTGADPVKFGFVTSFNRPGGNATGIWMVTTVLAEKQGGADCAARQSDKSCR
jgi:putative ABC transport system substrate-binding protein